MKKVMTLCHISQTQDLKHSILCSLAGSLLGDTKEDGRAWSAVQWERVYKNIRTESARSIDPSGQMGQEVMSREIKQSETVV
jgi:hypothetical protein